MTKAETIHNMCIFPRTIHEKNTIPVIELWAATGYEQYRGVIMQEDILEYLEKHSNLIDDWWNYSDSKRSSPSWLLIPTKGGCYTVGYFENFVMPYELFFRNGLDACTLYIKMEFESFKQHYKKY